MRQTSRRVRPSSSIATARLRVATSCIHGQCHSRTTVSASPRCAVYRHFLGMCRRLKPLARDDCVVRSRALASVREWRLRSRAAGVLDLIMAMAGVGIITVAAIDSLVTWPSDTIWISPMSLEHAMAFLVIPGWSWLLFGCAILPSWDSQRFDLRRIGRRRATGLVMTATVCLAVVVGGFLIGGAKGHVRVLPGPRYQVATPGLNDADWTTVSASQYRVWEARFLREDGLFTLFGLFMIVGAVAVAGVRRSSAASLEGSTAGAV